MAILVFEDELVSRLHPVTLARPAYAISCGGYRLIDWLRWLALPLQSAVRGYLSELQQVDFADVAAPQPQAPGPRLLVNARLAPSHSHARVLQAIWRERRPCVVRCGEHVAAALLGPDSPPLPTRLAPHAMQDALSALGVAQLPPHDGPLALFAWPHDIVRFNAAMLGENLAHRLASGNYREVADGVFANGEVSLGQYVVTNATAGPVLLETGVKVGPFCYLQGPGYVGANAKLIEHAAIKDGVSIGHTTKIGGEVEASVIEPYTNKQHHGFLGHSYLGSWINLGAGTCNSDLKNTYGTVNVEYRGQRVATGLQFVGCVMGDYSKTAINTSIFTGKTIGACSMLYGFVISNVPSFVNYARSFGQVAEVPPDVMIQSQQRMFQRRHVQQRPCDIQLLRDMYDLTHDDRQATSEPLSL